MKKPLTVLAGKLVRFVPRKWKKGLANLIRRGKPLNRTQLADETEKEMVRLLAMFLGLLIAFLFLQLLSESPKGEKKDSRVITRPRDGESRRIPLILRDGNEEKEILLEIGPEELSDEEFACIAEKELETLPDRILGKNESLERITDHLTLPVRTAEGNLEITWQSDHPDILSSRGKVSRGSLSAPLEVALTATIAADHREAKETYLCIVFPQEKDAWEMAEESLQNQEREAKTDPSFVLPEEVNGMTVEKSVRKGPDRTALLVLLFFAIVILPVTFRILAIRRAGEARQEEMKDGYFRFVNQLSLYLGAGLSIPEALRRFTYSCTEKSLQEEVRFTLNRLRCGWSEPDALTELGRNIGLPEYKKVLALISQNLYHGSDQLLMLLADEEQEAVNSKKERTRKKGEEASEKLLLPTGLLLLTVVGIVVYPALVGM